MKTSLWVFLLFCVTSRLFGLDYSSKELGFSVKLPDGWEDVTKTVHKQEILISLAKFDKDKQLLQAVMLEDMGGVIGRDDISKDIPANTTLQKVAWKSFEISVVRVPESTNGTNYVTINAQVPLKPHAIIIRAFGAAKDEAQIREQMLSILATMDGKTNWLTDDQRAFLLGRGVGKLLGCGLVVGLFIFAAKKLFSRKT